MKEDEYGFNYPLIKEDKCVGCNLCVSVCEKVNNNQSDMPLIAFAGSHKNKQVLNKSSSGGVFSALAEQFLENGGAVCGCVFNDELKAVHICTEKEDDFLKIRKSKYLQSDVGFIYREIKSRLKNGQQVLFTGTPCQVAALYAVVGKNYPNLTTMDLICHGVPSQRMFDKFIEYLEKRYKTKITSFDFRSKKYGWQRFTMEFTGSNNKVVNIGKYREFYIPAFTGGNIIRPSCLSCKFACANRISDITVGDFWGYENSNLKLDTSKGMSVFTINTENAKNLLSSLSEKLYFEEIDYKVAVTGNTCLHKPTPEGKKRELYMQAIKNNNIEAVALKYRKSKKKSILREKLRLLVPTRIFIAIKKHKSKN